MYKFFFLFFFLYFKCFLTFFKKFVFLHNLPITPAVKVKKIVQKSQVLNYKKNAKIKKFLKKQGFFVFLITFLYF